MQIEILKDFQLVGGTALALCLGHRISVDIDLFSNRSFDNEEVINSLNNHFSDRFELKSRIANKLGVFCLIDGVKVDICRHGQELLDPVLEIEGIRMWGLKDITASKVNAISRRATKKDFWDIDRLLDIYDIKEIASFYRSKYLPMLAIGVAQMLTYYTDAEESDTPICLLNKNWEGVKKSIFKKINNQIK
jgi:predicted nucleotidyltransferase component of viral defense system